MVSKRQLLEFSITNFIKFGSKSITMDNLANDLGISKKTLYSCFKNKEELVTESLSFFLKKIKQQMDEVISKENDPILKVILIYEIGFSYLNSFKPSFIFELKKYYPRADAVFEAFRDDIVNHKVRNLLEEAQWKKLLRQDVDIDLMCKLYFLRVENITFKHNNLFENYSTDVLLQYLIVNNLRGIVASGYSNRIFER